MLNDEDDLDLGDILPDDLFNHPDCFDSRFYSRWEREIATPALEALGWTVCGWWSADQDSFGPLVRCVKLTRDGIEETYSYG